VKNPFIALKEKAIAAGIKGVINREIEGCGIVTELELDTEARTIRVELDLKGETAAVIVEILDYELATKGDAIFMEIKKISASREWIAAALKKFAVGRPIELPSAAKVLL
jgi:hypothetical protein